MNFRVRAVFVFVQKEEKKMKNKNWNWNFGVINDCLRKQRLIFWLAHKVSHWLNQPENRNVAKFNIRGVSFGG